MAFAPKHGKSSTGNKMTMMNNRGQADVSASNNHTDSNPKTTKHKAHANKTNFVKQTQNLSTRKNEKPITNLTPFSQQTRPLCRISMGWQKESTDTYLTLQRIPFIFWNRHPQKLTPASRHAHENSPSQRGRLIFMHIKCIWKYEGFVPLYT